MCVKIFKFETKNYNLKLLQNLQQRLYLNKYGKVDSIGDYTESFNMLLYQNTTFYAGLGSELQHDFQIREYHFNFLYLILQR